MTRLFVGQPRLHRVCQLSQIESMSAHLYWIRHVVRVESLSLAPRGLHGPWVTLLAPHSRAPHTRAPHSRALVGGHARPLRHARLWLWRVARLGRHHPWPGHRGHHAGLWGPSHAVGGHHAWLRGSSHVSWGHHAGLLLDGGHTRLWRHHARSSHHRSGPRGHHARLWRPSVRLGGHAGVGGTRGHGASHRVGGHHAGLWRASHTVGGHHARLQRSSHTVGRHHAGLRGASNTTRGHHASHGTRRASHRAWRHHIGLWGSSH